MKLIHSLFSTLIILITINCNTLPHELSTFSEKQDIRRLEYNIEQIEQSPKYEDMFLPSEEQSDYSLPEWIIEQNQQTAKQSVHYQNIVQEQFSISLQHKGQFIFKWDPSKNKQLCLQIYLKFVNKVGQLDFPVGEKSQFLQVFSKRRERDTYSYVDKVYFHKRILIDFDTDYRIIRFLNLYPQKIIVDIKLQWAGNVIKEGVKDSQFEENRNRMMNLVNGMKNIIKINEKLFQLERSIAEQRQEHHKKYTLLTGAELVCILVTSLIQAHCTKRLLENKMSPGSNLVTEKITTILKKVLVIQFPQFQQKQSLKQIFNDIFIKMDNPKLNEIDSHNLTDRSLSNSGSQSRHRLKRTNNNSFFNFNAKLKKNQIKKQLNSADQNKSVRYTPLKKSLTCQISDSPLRQDLLHTTVVNLDPKKLMQKDILRRSRMQCDKKSNKDSEDYYKFWKDKANQYQSANFNLQRINSALEQELEIVKHHNQKLERKVEKQMIPTFRESFSDSLQKQKIEKFYSLKIEALTKKIEEQEIIIKKQDQKIKQLSRQMSENCKLKNLLENMQDKVSEMNSIDDQKSARSSRKNSIKKIIMPPNLRIGSSSKDLTLKTQRRANTYRFYVPDSPSINNFEIAHNDTLSVEEQMEPSLQKCRSNHDLNNRFMSETEIGKKFNLF